MQQGYIMITSPIWISLLGRKCSTKIQRYLHPQRSLRRAHCVHHDGEQACCVHGVLARCMRGERPAACVAQCAWRAGQLRAWRSVRGEWARCMRGKTCVANGPLRASQLEAGLLRAWRAGPLRAWRGGPAACMVCWPAACVAKGLMRAR
jgi:hypothetical protein